MAAVDCLAVGSEGGARVTVDGGPTWRGASRAGAGAGARIAGARSGSSSRAERLRAPVMGEAAAQRKGAAKGGAEAPVMRPEEAASLNADALVSSSAARTGPRRSPGATQSTCGCCSCVMTRSPCSGRRGDELDATVARGTSRTGSQRRVECREERLLGEAATAASCERGKKRNARRNGVK